MKIVGRENPSNASGQSFAANPATRSALARLHVRFQHVARFPRPRTVTEFARAQAFDNEAYRVNFTPEAPESYELLNDIGTIRERRTLCATWRNNTGCVAYSVGQKEGDFVCSC
jgi:hypothetical protein